MVVDRNSTKVMLRHRQGRSAQLGHSQMLLLSTMHYSNRHRLLSKPRTHAFKVELEARLGSYVLQHANRFPCHFRSDAIPGQDDDVVAFGHGASVLLLQCL